MSTARQLSKDKAKDPGTVTIMGEERDKRMSLTKFLGRREKSKGRAEPSSSRRSYFGGLFNVIEPTEIEQDTKKVQEIQQQLCKLQAGTFSDEDVQHALGLYYTKGDVLKTVEFLKYLQDAKDLLINPYDPETKFLGAVNRDNTTCYLDSLLFAMFGCQDSYEPMLVNRFGNGKKDRLAALLRLWVNLERAGKLVTTDITRQIQDALAECGWPEAAEKRQQDAGEAFTFITEQLGLPNLYLKMNLFHHGKEDAKDDHKIVQERLLEMPIPDPSEGRSTITLEDCAEEALNAKVEVRRVLEGRQRGYTSGSVVSQNSFDSSKGNAVHIETVEVKKSGTSTPVSTRAHSPVPSEQTKRPLHLHKRTPSIIQESVVPSDAEGLEKSEGSRTRAGSVRKEVMIPAWQMYSLIPFHSGYSPENDAQVAHHFRSKQPIFGIRLKRYGFSTDGKPTRKETYIDIPLEMAFPTFIHDERSEDDFGGFGKFKLTLQSAVCHRGKSTESGHYISLVKGSKTNEEVKWLKFDDLAEERVREINILSFLKKETPYLLFYQVRLIEANDAIRYPGSVDSTDKDSGVGGLSSVVSTEPRQSIEEQSIGTTKDDLIRIRRASIAVTESVANGNVNDSLSKTKPISSSLSVDNSALPSRQGSKLSKSSSKSRPASSGEQNLTAALNRLTGRSSTEAVDRSVTNFPLDQPSKPAANTMAEVVIAAQEKEKARLKKKEEKSRKRLSTVIKNKNSSAPDRECLLM